MSSTLQWIGKRVDFLHFKVLNFNRSVNTYQIIYDFRCWKIFCTPIDFRSQDFRIEVPLLHSFLSSSTSKIFKEFSTTVCLFRLLQQSYRFQLSFFVFEQHCFAVVSLGCIHVLRKKNNTIKLQLLHHLAVERNQFDQEVLL